MYQSTPYCKVHFLEMFKERGTYAVFKDDYDPSMPAFKSRSGLQASLSANAPPSTLSSGPKLSARATASPASSQPESLSAPPTTNASSAPAEQEQPSSSEAGTGSVRDRLKKFDSAAPPANPAEKPTETPPEAKPDEEAEAGGNDESDGIGFGVFNALKSGDVEELRVAVLQAGLQSLFDKDEDGATPIEIAFRSGNLEQGRMLIDVVHKQITTMRQQKRTTAA